MLWVLADVHSPCQISHTFYIFLLCGSAASLATWLCLDSCRNNCAIERWLPEVLLGTDCFSELEGKKMGPYPKKLPPSFKDCCFTLPDSRAPRAL